MYSFVFITNRRASFCSIILIIGLSTLSRSGSGKCHSPLLYLKAWNRLINSSFLLLRTQFPAETRLSIYGSPFVAHKQDTAGTFPAPPDPTDPTGKVLTLRNDKYSRSLSVSNRWFPSYDHVTLFLFCSFSRSNDSSAVHSYSAWNQSRSDICCTLQW